MNINTCFVFLKSQKFKNLYYLPHCIVMASQYHKFFMSAEIPYYFMKLDTVDCAVESWFGTFLSWPNHLKQYLSSTSGYGWRWGTVAKRKEQTLQWYTIQYTPSQNNSRNMTSKIFQTFCGDFSSWVIWQNTSFGHFAHHQRNGEH